MKHLWAIGFLILTGIAPGQEYYEVSTVDIDERYDHFMPVFYGDRIVFSSTNADEDVIKYTDKGSEKTPSSIFVATIIDGQLIDNPELLAKNIRTNFHEGPATFSSDGRVMIFTRNLYTKQGNNKNGRNKLGLFISNLENGIWTDPVPFEYNDTKYSVGHPSLSSNGKYLYFASNMPGGSGGTDLYVCEYKNGKWKRPENLGSKVNSNASEMFPVVKDNKLYFSSDREGGLGMLDIYMSHSKKGKWSKPIALPEPLNSMADDMGFAPLADKKTGYLSSNRNGSDQILFFKRTIPVFVDCRPQVENNYCYVFTEEGTIHGDSLPLIYQWDLGDGNKKNGTKAEHCYSGSGNYIVKLNVIDTITQRIFFNAASYELEIVDEEQPYITVDGPMFSRQLITFSAADSKLQNKQIAEYHWSLGDDADLQGIEVNKKFKDHGEILIKLDVIFEPNEAGRITHQCVTRIINLHEPKQIVEVSDETVLVEYTDADGELHQFTYQELPYDLFNLSINEGDDIFFTVELMASKERTSTDDALFDEARKKYLIIETYISEKEHFSYSVGKSKTLEGTYSIYADLLAMNYNPEVKAVTVEKIKEIGNPEDMAELEQMNVKDLNNTVLRMSTVYFGSGKFNIDPEFSGSLDILFDLISAFDKIDLEISAHTDDSGKKSFNQELSEKRAIAIVDYLEAKGLSRDRMKAIGYGEDKPIASNSNEEGKQLNRRVEFKLVATSLLSSEKWIGIDN